jgi:hypothetical protein
MGGPSHNFTRWTKRSFATEQLSCVGGASTEVGYCESVERAVSALSSADFALNASSSTVPARYAFSNRFCIATSSDFRLANVAARRR